MVGIVTYGLVFAMLAVGTLRMPARGLAAVLCLYGLKQWGQSSNSWLASHSPATNIAIGVLVLIGLLVRMGQGKCLLCRLPIASSLILVLYFYALCSIAWTPDPGGSIQQWRLQWPYLVTVIALAPLLIDDLEDFRSALHWTVLAGGALCALALIFGKWGNRGLLIFGDIYEQQTNPLAIAGMGGTVFLAAMLSLQKDSNPLKRILFIAVIPIAIAIILKSGSRGQLVAAMTAVFVAWPIAYPQKNLGSFVLWAATFMILALLASEAVQFLQADTARWSGEGSAQDVAGRLDMAFALLAKAASNPFTLLFGLGNSAAFYYVGFYPHITLLEVIGEEGLVGLGVYGVILWLGVRSAIRLASSSAVAHSTHNRNALAILIAAFIFELLLTFKQGSLLSSTYAFAYVVLLGRLETAASEKAAAPTVATAYALPTQRFPNLLR